MSIDENTFYSEFETYVKQGLLHYYTTIVYPNYKKQNQFKGNNLIRLEMGQKPVYMLPEPYALEQELVRHGWNGSRIYHIFSLAGDPKIHFLYEVFHLKPDDYYSLKQNYNEFKELAQKIEVNVQYLPNHLCLLYKKLNHN